MEIEDALMEIQRLRALITLLSEAADVAELRKLLRERRNSPTISAQEMRARVIDQLLEGVGDEQYTPRPPVTRLPIKGLICDSAKIVDGSIVWDMGRLELILQRLGVSPISHERAKVWGREIDAELAAQRAQ